MPRFYCAQALQTHTSINLPEQIAHHLHVLRMAPGQRITLFDGQGHEFDAMLTSLDKKSASAEITEQRMRHTELPYRLTLAQALPEGSKMDWIIEKAIELGASAIQPLAAQRSVVKLSPERAAKRLQHWQGVIVAASEQSGRTRIADLNEVTDLVRWSSQPQPAQRLLLTPRSDHSLAAWALSEPARDITLVIGPEGGFNEQEEKLLISQGVLPVSMGPRILRTETAGLAAMAIINAAWGQM